KRVLQIPGSTVSALRRRVLANSLKTSNAISLPGLTSLNRSGFDAIILYHFDAAELAPSTASKADICSANRHVCFTPESRHLQCTRLCPLWANSGHQAVPQKLNLPDLRIFTSNLLLAQCDQQSPSLIYVLDKRDRCMWRRQRSLNERSRASGD